VTEDHSGLRGWIEPTDAQMWSCTDRELAEIEDEALAAWVGGRPGAESWWSAARLEHARRGES
jgi:hypothetical protein